VNPAEADKEIRSQLCRPSRAGRPTWRSHEAVKAFPTIAINSRLPKVSYSFWHLIEHIRLAQRHARYMTSTSYEDLPFRKAMAGEGRRARRRPSGGDRSSSSTRDLQR
jgi:hypothetical protein